MAHITCKCGNVISNTGFPSRHIYGVFTDEHMGSIDYHKTLDGMHEDFEIWRCQHCGRLYVFEHGAKTYSRIFKPEKLSDE